MKQILKYLTCFLVGFIIYLLINRKNRFSVGIGFQPTPRMQELIREINSGRPAPAPAPAPDAGGGGGGGGPAISEGVPPGPAIVVPDGGWATLAEGQQLLHQWNIWATDDDFIDNTVYDAHGNPVEGLNAAPPIQVPPEGVPPPCFDDDVNIEDLYEDLEPDVNADAVASTPEIIASSATRALEDLGFDMFGDKGFHEKIADVFKKSGMCDIGDNNIKHILDTLNKFNLGQGTRHRLSGPTLGLPLELCGLIESMSGGFFRFNLGLFDMLIEILVGDGFLDTFFVNDMMEICLKFIIYFDYLMVETGFGLGLGGERAQGRVHRHPQALGGVGGDLPTGPLQTWYIIRSQMRNLLKVVLKIYTTWDMLDESMSWVTSPRSVFDNIIGFGLSTPTQYMSTPSGASYLMHWSRTRWAREYANEAALRYHHARNTTATFTRDFIITMVLYAYMINRPIRIWWTGHVTGPSLPNSASITTFQQLVDRAAAQLQIVTGMLSQRDSSRWGAAEDEPVGVIEDLLLMLEQLILGIETHPADHSYDLPHIPDLD